MKRNLLTGFIIVILIFPSLILANGPSDSVNLIFSILPPLDEIPPEKVEIVSVADVKNDAGGKIKVEWQLLTAEDIDFYQVWYATEVFTSTSTATLYSSTTTQNNIIVEGLSIDQKYYFAVNAKDISGNIGELSDVLGPIWAVNNIVNNVGKDAEILCSFDPRHRVVVPKDVPENNNLKINIIKVSEDKKEIVEDANLAAKDDPRILNETIQQLKETELEIVVDRQPTGLLKVTIGYLADIDEQIEGTLRIFKLNEVTGKWELVEPPVQEIDKNNNTVSCWVGEFSIFRVFGTELASPNLANVKVYPNPYKPSSGHSMINFANLTSEAKIYIYNVAGELVRELEENDGDGLYQWDATNERGEKLASGVYIYYITSNDNDSVKGKFAIIK